MYTEQAFGDTARLALIRGNMDSVRHVGLYDIATGANPARLSKIRWMSINVEAGTVLCCSAKVLVA